MTIIRKSRPPAAVAGGVTEVTGGLLRETPSAHLDATTRRAQRRTMVSEALLSLAGMSAALTGLTWPHAGSPDDTRSDDG